MSEEQQLQSLGLTPLTKEEITALATGIVKSEIFTSVHVPPEDMDMLRHIWMPLGLGLLAGKDHTEIGMFYSNLKDAGPMSINGYPMFMSISILRHDQFEELRQEVLRVSTELGIG